MKKCMYLVVLSLLTVALLQVYGRPPAPPEHFDSPFIEDLRGPQADSKFKTGAWLVEYYTPWCPICQKFAPQYKQVAQALFDQDELDLKKRFSLDFATDYKQLVHIAKVNCAVHQNTPHCDMQALSGYPSLYLFQNGNRVEEYVGDRNAQSVVFYLKSKGLLTAPSSDVASQQKNPQSGGQYITDLTPEAFEWFVKNNAALAIVEFYSNMCHHCKAFKPHFEQVAKDLISSGEAAEFKASHYRNVIVGRVDCLDSDAGNGELCQENDIFSFPTVRAFTFDGKVIQTFNGAPKAEPFAQWIKSVMKEVGQKYPPSQQTMLQPLKDPLKPEQLADKESADDVKSLLKTDDNDRIIKSDGQVVVLTDDKLNSFESTIAKGPWFIEFYAPWCHHCKKLEPVWTKLAQELRDSTRFGKVDCTSNTALCKIHHVKGYPTLLFFYNGKMVADYRNPRTIEMLKDFALQMSRQIVQKLTDVNQFSKLNSQDTSSIISSVSLVLITPGKVQQSDVDSFEVVAKKYYRDANFYVLSDPSGYTKYKLSDTSSKYIVIFKDNTQISQKITSIEDDSVSEWISQNRFPIVIAMNEFNSADVFALKRPVVMGILANDHSKAEILMMKDAAAALPRQKSMEQNGYVFVWISGLQWAKYIDANFGIKDSSKLPSLVIISPNGQQYYDGYQDGLKFQFTSSQSIKMAIQAVEDGESTPKSLSSDSVAGNMVRNVQQFFAEHPIISMIMIVSLCAFVYLATRQTSEDLSSYLPVKAD
ncbi:hypothetical protein MP228_006724 [Amoeboaphelidium protococcarum]|nr:hypothetical protein MP228_006724 [Amoeboaphelidium protococcarum]